MRGHFTVAPGKLEKVKLSDLCPFSLIQRDKNRFGSSEGKMDIMVEFTGGGPLDGKNLDSAVNPELGETKATWILRLVSASLDLAARKEEKPRTLLVWRQPSAQIAERAKTEQWPEAKVAALMQYHEYDITSFEEIEGLVIFKACYRGTK